VLAFAVVQARGAFLQLFLIYLVLCTVPLALGASLLFAPHRAGNFLNDAFAIFPPVSPDDTLKKIFYRSLGAGLIAVSIFYGHQVFANLVRPIIHFLSRT